MMFTQGQQGRTCNIYKYIFICLHMRVKGHHHNYLYPAGMYLVTYLYQDGDYVV